MIRLKEMKEKHILQEMKEEMRQETTMTMIEETIIDREKDRQQIHTITIKTKEADLTKDRGIQQREILEDQTTINKISSTGR